MDYQPIAGTTVVGLVGRSRHGKDSIAKAMLQMTPGAERFAFSDAIATYARVSGEMAERDPRVLQDVGWRLRQQFPDVWLRSLYWAIRDRQPVLAVVTGVRFQDEAELIAAMGGTLVRVKRLEADGTLYQSADRDPNHEVERQIDGLACRHECQIGNGNLEMIPRAAAWLLDQLRMGLSQECVTVGTTAA